jgi:hypothetical protein
MSDLAKSLEELEGEAWGQPEYDSYLVTTAHRLRKKPLRDFTIEDFRLMLGQAIGIPFLLPLALEQLEVEPFAEGDFYAGDLLVTCTKLDLPTLRTHPALLQRLRAVAERAVRDLGAHPEAPQELRHDLEAFLGWAAA